MKLGSLDGRDYGELTSGGLVKIYVIFATQEEFLYGIAL